MNQAVADIIKGQIEGLDFVDKIAGLVSTAHIEIKGPDGPVEKSFPIACCTTADDCKEGAYNDLMPNSAYNTVIYFEDGGVSFVKYESNKKYYTSTLKLVCWINIAKIISDTCKTGTVCTRSAHIITEIIRALPLFPEEHTPFHQFYSEVVGQEPRSNSIFSQYTFDEKHIQYLMYPYDYFALTIKTDFAICLDSDVVPAPCEDVIDQMTPVASEAEDIDCLSFKAVWEIETEATGYYLDVSTVNTFASFVAGYQNLDVGDVQEYTVTGLTDHTIYYYRVRCYDDNDTSDSSNVITVTTLFCDWFLPSIDELNAMYSLHALGLGDFADAVYWSSTEDDATSSEGIDFNTGIWLINENKTSLYHVRACRSFVDVAGAYVIGDTGPAGGLISYIDGATTYYEAAPSDQSISKSWSNIVNVAIGTTSVAVGEGQNNTNEIIAQAGHTDSAAKLCNDLEI